MRLYMWVSARIYTHTYLLALLRGPRNNDNTPIATSTPSAQVLVSNAIIY